MARTLLDKNLTYKDGTGTDIKIRMTDVVDLESDLKCLTNQLSMDMLKSLSEGMKPTDDFFSYFRCKRPTYHYNVKMLKDRGFVKIDRVGGIKHYILNIKKLNELDKMINRNDE